MTTRPRLSNEDLDRLVVSVVANPTPEMRNLRQTWRRRGIARVLASAPDRHRSRGAGRAQSWRVSQTDEGWSVEIRFIDQDNQARLWRPATGQWIAPVRRQPNRTTWLQADDLVGINQAIATAKLDRRFKQNKELA